MNENIFLFFYNLTHQSNIFDGAVIFFGNYFPYIVILLAGAYLFFYRKSWKELFIVFLSGGVAVALDVVLKHLIKAPRPFVEFGSVQTLFTESGYAFPSGHAMFFMAIAVAIFFVNKKAGYLFGFFAVLIGLARITAGVHFPEDIFGGFVLGALTAWFIQLYFLPFVQKLQKVL